MSPATMPISVIIKNNLRLKLSDYDRRALEIKQSLHQTVFGVLFIVGLALRALGDLVMGRVHIGVGADGAFPDIGVFPHILRKGALFFEEDPENEHG